MKSISLLNALVFGSLILKQTMGCLIWNRYDYTVYDQCSGEYCEHDFQCESSDCSDNHCKYVLPPYAIFLIVFFSISCFFTILRICIRVCARKPQVRVVQRNSANGRPNSLLQYHNQDPQPTTQQLIVTQTTVPGQVVPGQQQLPYQYGNPMGQDYNPYGQNGYSAPVFNNQNNMYIPPGQNLNNQQLPLAQHQPPIQTQIQDNSFLSDDVSQKNKKK
ncbi:UNKNOWN [Stylonychia lemnae]|uniref:Transmembrane protein n=1 Tax=Stylonychia lemnae TaxID=5949 RepID=A0A078B3Y6_STYLE|nr:UNKNOWN [Stylonychia lemnae]|eukprot:CDW88946.1 UNKNOWN [Stylonychia lemnae]